jgi:hypothetical protein
MAHSRGRDWGLPDAAHGSVPITRPIRVQCHADRLVVMPEAGVAAGKAIPLGPRTETAVDTFVSAVWEHMGSWGMAGNGMFWRPVLKIEVAPDAEQRFADLSELLEQSGLAVERKN